MIPNFSTPWQKVVPQLRNVLEKMEEKTIIALGVAPYPRIIPSLFLRNYLIYSVKDTADLDILRQYAKIFCLEEKFPKLAPKIHSTNYLLGNYAFQAFLKSMRRPFKLMFYQTTPPIIKKLEEQNIGWIGNRPESFQDVLFKSAFRDVLKSLKLPHLEDWKISRKEFLLKKFEELYQKWNRSFVVQRADFDVSGEQGTFFIRTQKDWKTMYQILSKDERYQWIQISPFVEGYSVSMLGCITHLGVLTSPLQLQLIDVPEALHDQLPTGVFLGHDWGFRQWDAQTENISKKIVEKIGEFLAKKGYLGIFGIDLIYDTETAKLFPIECNPRFTGALPVFSLIATYNNKIPPLEFFHLMAHLNIKEKFNFDLVNKTLKDRLPISHISITPKGIYKMKLPLRSGVYSFSEEIPGLIYQRPGAFLWDLKNKSEFIIIDSVPRQEGNVIQNVPRLFKIIFPRSIAISSFEVKPDVGKFITAFSTALHKNQFVEEKEELSEELKKFQY